MRPRLIVITVALGAIALAACSSDVESSIEGASRTPAPGAITQAPQPTSSAQDSTFTSSQYGYTAALPTGWTALPATSGWDGGDVDHTADYADRFTDRDGNEYFVIGTPIAQSTDEFTGAHLAWLSDNRGCPAPAVESTVSIDGVRGARVAVHCPDGVFGPTLVSKAITVRDGAGLIVTSFSPDTGSDDFTPLDALVSSMRWTPRS